MKYAPLAGFLLLCVLLGVGLGLDNDDLPSQLIDKPVPAFSLPQLVADAAAAPQLTQTSLQGEVTLLNVWASWCVACRAEHPVLLDIAKVSQVRLVGINYKDQHGQALQWLERYGDPYAYSIVDGPGRLGIDLGVYGVPETFLLDKQGVIRYKHIGPITWQDWVTTLAPLVTKYQES